MARSHPVNANRGSIEIAKARQADVAFISTLRNYLIRTQRLSTPALLACIASAPGVD